MATGTSPSVLAVLVALPVLLFFRDPERTPEGGDGSIIAPADGKVIDVRTTSTGHPLAPEACQRISIFMSPLDVHVNRAPVTGRVEEISYRKGQFRAAYAGDASEVNESNSMRMRTPDGIPVVVVQIAGWLARRIVCRVARGARLARGERFGLIMFGSRVDVYLPANASIIASPSQRVWAGRTVIGTLDRAPEQAAAPERVS
jgi:phosphatidylserine decarboxylase